MQAVHRKLDVVLVQILPHNSETDYSFCENLPRSRTPPSTQMRVSPSDPFSLTIFFAPPPLELAIEQWGCTPCTPSGALRPDPNIGSRSRARDDRGSSPHT